MSEPVAEHHPKPKPKGGTLIPGVPNWVTALGGGLAVGVVYLIWRGRKAKPDAGADQKPQQLPQYGQPNGNTIVPVNQGLNDNQVQDLVAAISSLHGAPSTPKPPPHHRHHDDDDDDDDHDEQVKKLAKQTGESEAQIRWELEGKDPGEGPDPRPDGPYIDSDLYGSWSRGDNDTEENRPHNRGGRGHGGQRHQPDGGDDD